MNKLVISILAILITNFSAFAQEFSPYIKVGESTKNIQQVSDEVIAALNNASFTILGKFIFSM